MSKREVNITAAANPIIIRYVDSALWDNEDKVLVQFCVSAHQRYKNED